MTSYHQPGKAFASPDLFVQKAKEQKHVDTLQADLQDVIRKSYPSIPVLVNAIEATGVPVLMNGPEFQLRLSLMIMGTASGFVPPTLNKYADLVVSLKKYFPDKAQMDFSKGVMVILKDNRSFTFLAYQFYHWMAFQQGLDGYEHKARKLYNTFNTKYAGELSPKLLNQLDIEEVQLLRSAIRRDRDATQFIRGLLHDVFIPKNNAKLLNTGKAQA